MSRKAVKSFFFAVVGALLGSTLSVPAAAQDVDSLRQALLVPLPPAVAVLSTVGRVSPGSSAGSPVAFGANFGDGFVGAGFQGRTRYASANLRDAMDGSLVVGFGLGNSRDLIGLEVSAVSFSTVDSGPFKRASVGLKLHRSLPGSVGVGVGLENAVHTSDFFAARTVYGVVSKVWGQGGFNPFRTVTTSIGVGNGRFRSEEDARADTKTANVFASAGVQLTSFASVIADWTGQDLNLGVSLVPFRGVPLIITPSLADVTGNAGDGARFTLGGGLGFKFADAGRLFP